ncbi:uncharacterized protein LOC130896046 isoform X2 [Diorhabda carinulata]|uniref:uncharacterized protein LOC130896046 isoform X2 n=1 Tax=Diorhabda carinulata TaxID=1163345 RepID=UPI0025A02867|nr:uncharacterized protein LOC130896046 isoform X2 [Diorhabda carinulata]
MNSVLKNVCKLKVPLKVVERPHKSCETEKLVICPKPSLNFYRSRSYIASYNEVVVNSLPTSGTHSNLSCNLRRSFAQKAKHTGYGRTAASDDNDKKKDEVSEEQCMSQKSDKRDKKGSEKTIKFTINLNELIHNFNRKTNLMKAQGINKINTFSLKPIKCRCCTSRNKNQMYKFGQRRFISISSKGRMQLPKYPVNKIRKCLSYKPQSGGALSYKIRDASSSMYWKDKVLKVPLFHIIKDKIHSSPPVVQELNKQLRYYIGTGEASFGNRKQSSNPHLNCDSNNIDKSQALKSICNNKPCAQIPNITGKISEYTMSFDNFKKSHILQMLTEILIPLIEKESMQYEEMRKAFVQLKKELELYFMQVEKLGVRSENEVFKIIADMNQTKRRQKELETASLLVKEFLRKSKTIDSYSNEDKCCVYGSYSDNTSNNQRGNENSQLDEFPMAILVKDRKQPPEHQNAHSYLGIGNSTKNSLKEKENKYIATRTFASDSKSTKYESDLGMESSLNSSIDQESDAGCFQYFQSKSIPREITQKQKEQFAIPSEFREANAVRMKSHHPILTRQTASKDDLSVKSATAGFAIYDTSTVMPSSHSSYKSDPKNKIGQLKPTLQAPISKAGMENLKRLEKLEQLKEAEVRLPFQDDSSQKNIEILKPNELIGKQFSHSNNIPTQFPLKTAKTKDSVKPKSIVNNKIIPKHISKNQSTPTLNTAPAVNKKSVENLTFEKRLPLSLLDNCRGLLETLLRKFKGPPKRNLGSSFLSRKSHSAPALMIVDNYQKNDESRIKMIKPVVTVQLKQKYPWNRLGLNKKMSRKFRSGARRVYSTEARIYSFSKKDYSTSQNNNTKITEKCFKNKYPWNFTEIEASENTNCCYLTQTSYCNTNNISTSEPEVPKVCDNVITCGNKIESSKIDTKNEQLEKVCGQNKVDENKCKDANQKKADSEPQKNKCEKKAKIVERPCEQNDQQQSETSKCKLFNRGNKMTTEETTDCMKKNENKVTKTVDKKLSCTRKSSAKNKKPEESCSTKKLKRETDNTKCVETKKSVNQDDKSKQPLSDCDNKQDTRPKEPICNLCPKPKDEPKKVESETKCSKTKKPVCPDDKPKKPKLNSADCKKSEDSGPEKLKSNLCPKPKDEPKQVESDTFTKNPVCQDNMPKKAESTSADCKSKQDTRPKEPICNLCPKPKDEPKKVEGETKCVKTKKPVCPDDESKKPKSNSADCQIRQDSRPKEPNCNLCSKPKDSPKQVKSDTKCVETKQPVCSDNRSNKAKKSINESSPSTFESKKESRPKEPVCKTREADNKSSKEIGSKGDNGCSKQTSWSSLVGANKSSPNLLCLESSSGAKNESNTSKIMKCKEKNKNDSCNTKTADTRVKEQKCPSRKCLGDNEILCDKSSSSTTSPSSKAKDLVTRPTNKPSDCSSNKDKNKICTSSKSVVSSSTPNTEKCPTDFNPEKKAIDLVRKASRKPEMCDKKESQLNNEEKLIKQTTSCQKQKKECGQKESTSKATLLEKKPLNKAACSDKKDKSLEPQRKARELVKKALSKPEICDGKKSDKQESKTCAQKPEKKSIEESASKKKCQKSVASSQFSKCEDKKVNKNKEKPSKECNKSEKNKQQSEKPKPCGKTATATTCQEQREKMENICNNKQKTKGCFTQKIFAKCVDEEIKRGDACKSGEKKVDKQFKCKKASEKEKNQSFKSDQIENVCDKNQNMGGKNDNKCNKGSETEKKCAKHENKEKCGKLRVEFMKQNKIGTKGDGCPSSDAIPKTTTKNSNKCMNEKKECSADTTDTSNAAVTNSLETSSSQNIIRPRETNYSIKQTMSKIPTKSIHFKEPVLVKSGTSTIAARDNLKSKTTNTSKIEKNRKKLSMKVSPKINNPEQITEKGWGREDSHEAHPSDLFNESEISSTPNTTNDLKEASVEQGDSQPIIPGKKSMIHNEVNANMRNESSGCDINLLRLPEKEKSTNILQSSEIPSSNIDENNSKTDTLRLSDVVTSHGRNISRNPSPINSDLSKPRVFDNDDGSEVFICKIDKLTKSDSEKHSRTLKCKLFRDESGREIFLCKELEDGMKAEHMEKANVSSVTKSKSSDVRSRSLSSKSDISSSHDNYVEIKPVRITREVLQRENEQMAKLLERYQSLETQDEKTKQRIYRLYSITRKLLSHYYLVDGEENSKLYFDYKDIVQRQHLKQRNDNIDTLKYHP